MQYRILGNTNIKISQIGFGCMSLFKTGIDESIDTIHKAIDVGINFFDTADMYDKGVNESLLGKALKTKRQQVVLATKVGNQWRADGSGWDWNPRKDYIITSIEGSLKRLQTEYVDLYQLHGGTIDDPIDETIETFELLQQQGKILQYGISSIRPNVIREYVKRSSMVSVMMQYSLLDRRPEESILHLLEQNNISVLARGALAQGMLVNKPAKEYLQYSKEQVTRFQKCLNELLGNSITKTAAAVLYVLYNTTVGSAVIGFRNREQLEDILAAIELRFQPNGLFEQLRAVIPAGVYTQHR